MGGVIAIAVVVDSLARTALDEKCDGRGVLGSRTELEGSSATPRLRRVLRTARDDPGRSRSRAEAGRSVGLVFFTVMEELDAIRPGRSWISTLLSGPTPDPDRRP